MGRAAARLGITAAAASNALRRLREDLSDPLLVKRGRGLVRTRLGEELRRSARDVMTSVETLLRTAKPFEALPYAGDIPIALAEHVAAMLLPELDRLARDRAPRATLMVSSIPLEIGDWLKKSGGVLVGPEGPFAATMAGDNLVSEEYYSERYVCVMRRAHPLARRNLSVEAYADQTHVLVAPRGRTARSDIDAILDAKGLSRRVARTVPSFQLAIPIVVQSDLITTMPERTSHQLSHKELTVKELPLKAVRLPMKLISHPAHQADGRTRFIKRLLIDALEKFDQRYG